LLDAFWYMILHDALQTPPSLIRTSLILAAHNSNPRNKLDPPEKSFHASCTISFSCFPFARSFSSIHARIFF
jgi:hypothetical protein